MTDIKSNTSSHNNCYHSSSAIFTANEIVHIAYRDSSLIHPSHDSRWFSRWWGAFSPSSSTLRQPNVAWSRFVSLYMCIKGFGNPQPKIVHFTSLTVLSRRKNTRNSGKLFFLNINNPNSTTLVTRMPQVKVVFEGENEIRRFLLPGSGAFEDLLGKVRTVLGDGVNFQLFWKGNPIILLLLINFFPFFQWMLFRIWSFPLIWLTIW